MVAFAGLGVFAALVARKNVGSESPARRLTRVPDALRELKSLMRVPRWDPFDDFDFDLDDVPPQASVDPWTTRQRVVEEREDQDPTVACELVERLAPLAGDPIDELLPPSHQEVLVELLREGEDLRSLGRLLKVDLDAYTKQLSKALSAARIGRLEECDLSLQFANVRLRERLESAIAKELPRFRSLSFQRR